MLLAHLKLRYCEFGRACVTRALDGITRPKIKYFGLLDNSQKDVVTMIESQVFKYWDDLATSPAKTRPAPPIPQVNISGLSLLSCSAAGKLTWPQSIMEKFPPESNQYKSMLKLKQDFEAEFGDRVVAEGVQSRSGQSRPARVSGQPDFTVDGGKEPVDVQRVLELEVHATAPAPDQRRGLFCFFF